MPHDSLNIPSMAALEWELCRRSAAYFIANHCHIYTTEAGQAGIWVKFGLWKEQIEVLETIDGHQKTIILKARQVGLTWLVLAYALWLMIFRPIATVLVYSARDTEAIYLLSDDRLRGMYARLPDYIRTRREQNQLIPLQIIDKGMHLFSLSNGSNVRAFPTSAGDSYTATLAIVDEADNSNDLNKLLQKVQPTIDAGGKLILLSRSYKDRPESAFKKIYRAAKDKANNYAYAFLPWNVAPNRSPEWYEAQKRDSIAQVGTLDNVWESYPATDAEALAPKEQDKRFVSKWLVDCFAEMQPITDEMKRSTPGIPSKATIYALPQAGTSYRIGGDPAEGNPNSDDSALCVVEKNTGAQVAKLSGKLEPRVFAGQIAQMSKLYNDAPVLIERNNHGHAVILELQNLGVELLNGYDDRPGWLNNSKGKTMLYDHTAEMLRTSDCKIVDFRTYSQLASIESDTLRAPDGLQDDESDAFCLAQQAIMQGEFGVTDRERQTFRRLSV